MAEALIAGILHQQLYLPEQIAVSEPQATRRAHWVERYGVRTTDCNQDVTAAVWLLLAIKPQVFLEVAGSLTLPLGARGVVSILAGVSLATLTKTFVDTPVVRAMPNTPALVGAGITALAAGDGVTHVQLNQVEAIFQAVGQVVRVPESSLDAVTGLSGSGPAYVALMVEALMDGGVAAGLPRDLARQLVLATVSGSVQLMVQENLQPAQLKDRVTSPGGTTIAGLAVLEQAAVRGAFIAAVLKATARSRELGQN